MHDLDGLSLQQLCNSVADAWRPRVAVDPIEFLPENVRFPSHWETTQFDFDSQPYARGVIQRFLMDDTKKKANLKWAARLGKTTLAISICIVMVKNDPCPMVVLYPDEDTLNNSLDGQVYPILDNTAFTAEQLPPLNQRNRTAIRFKECRMRIASGGKKSSVSGYPARVIIKIEVNKNPTRKSSEADPVLRVDSRAAGYARGVKILEEGTPTDKETCRSHELEISPDVQRLKYHVPCPHCKARQVLEFEHVKWQKDANGKSTMALARSTAYYECPRCSKKIEDHQRIEMIQGGVWLAEGERIDKRGRILGTPNVDGEIQQFELSALNSLLIDGWGVLASEFVDAQASSAQGNLQKLRKFQNEVLAKVWDPAQRITKAHKVAARLKCDDHQTIETLPKWTSFLTFTSDVGKIGEDLIFYWMTVAWGSPFTIPRGAIVDFGTEESKADFLQGWKDRSYAMHHNDARIRLWGQPAAIDSGDFTQEIYELCKPIRNCWPLKGDSRTNTTDLYRLGFARAGLSSRQIALKKKMSRPDLFEPSSDVTQGWRQALVEGRTSSADPGFVSLPADVCEQWETYRDFMDELTADQLVDGKWVGDDNEFGDTLRYARSLAECYVHGKYRGQWDRLPLIEAGETRGTAGLFRRSTGGK
ncbi:MAG: terminase gpA endonuclease subunit [Fuerstiella sp.]